MKCVLCARWSLNIICKECLEWIQIVPQKRDIDGFSVYSFYDFDEIRECLHSKYSVVGSKIFALLAQKAARFFLKEARFENVSGIALDDEPNGGYSHTAIIARAFKCAGIKPKVGVLRAKNRVSYAGRSLEFRQKNPRGFYANSLSGDVVLFDDLITTGSTMLEAKRAVEIGGASVLFGICLSDARGIVK